MHATQGDGEIAGNRATVNGVIEIGRAPGVIQVTFFAPLTALDAVGLSK